jgi:nucleotide-binding universal stress UspA family protein
MIALKKLLVPTDFTEPSGIALRYAKAFAEAFGAALHVLHVIEENAWAYGPDVYNPELIRQAQERDASERLSKVLTDAERQKFRAELVMKSGSPFVEIVRYAKAEDIDLIVMGTHGRGPIAHMLLGSVAEKVVRKAPCPVLTVRHAEHEFVMP